MKEPELLQVAREDIELSQKQSVLRQRVKNEVQRTGRFRAGLVETYRIMEQGPDHYIYKIKAFESELDEQFIAFDSASFARLLEFPMAGFAKVYELEPHQSIEGIILDHSDQVNSRRATQDDFRQFGELLELLENRNQGRSSELPERPDGIFGGHPIHD